MQLCECAACRMGVRSMKERRPGDGFRVEIDADGKLVYFVGPFVGLYCGGSIAIGEDKRDTGSMRAQMLRESVLFGETCGIAHFASVALDEDTAFAGLHYACGGERAGADGE